MLVNSTSATEGRKVTQIWLGAGLLGIVTLLTAAGIWLLWTLPDANAFNARVERIFVENAGLTGNDDIRLLEILAQSGTAFSDTLASYRGVIFVLIVFAAALLIAALAFLVLLLVMNRRLAHIERAGLQINSLLISRAENIVILNAMEFKLTEAAIETLSALAEARMDGDILSGVALEALISGRAEADCDEAAGATRIKRLRDALGNQLVSALIVKNVARRGYVLAVEKDIIDIV